MSELNEKIISDAAEQLRANLVRKSGLMIKAWDRIDGDISISCSLKFKPSDDFNSVKGEISIAFKIDEFKERDTYTFSSSDGFGPLFDRSNMRGLQKILFRDFSDLGAELERSERVRAEFDYVGDVSRREFENAKPVVEPDPIPTAAAESQPTAKRDAGFKARDYAEAEVIKGGVSEKTGLRYADL
jgi:hypothetical protein